MTEPAEEMKAMARRIVNDAWENWGALSTKERAEKSALAAIIETQRRDANLAENWTEYLLTMPPIATKSVTAVNIATAIRSGKQYGEE